MSRLAASWLRIEEETETEIIIIVICKFEEIIKVESRSYLLKDENNIIEEKVPNGEVVVHHLSHYHYNHPCHQHTLPLVERFPLLIYDLRLGLGLALHLIF